jgi:putative transposase
MIPLNMYNPPMDDDILRHKKVERHDIPYHAHALTFSCYQRRPFLMTGRTREWLGQAISMAADRHRMDIWCYVIMPEHVHLLVWPREEIYSISDVLLTIKQSTARRAVGYLKVHNPLGLKHLSTGQRNKPYRFWQTGGGYDRNIVGREALLKTVDYIHGNPVRRKLAATPVEWEWSSPRQWEGKADGPIPIQLSGFPSI